MTAANRMLVGVVNTCTALYATRIVYSPEPDFFVVLPDGSEGGREDIARLVRDHAGRVATSQ